MCIIVFKDKGVDMPNTSILRDCWDSNPDGAGVVIDNGSALLRIEKGFMEWKQFKAFLDKTKIKTEYRVAFHFRIATSGGVSESMCHPFPVSSNAKTLRSLKTLTTHAIMHNGVLGPGAKNESDTMMFVKNTLSKLKNRLFIPETKSLIQSISKGSRLLIMQPGKFYKTGNWIEENGLYFSNNSYQKFFMPYLECEEMIINLCPLCEAGEVVEISDINELFECDCCGSLFDRNMNRITLVSEYEAPF